MEGDQSDDRKAAHVHAAEAASDDEEDAKQQQLKRPHHCTHDHNHDHECDAPEHRLVVPADAVDFSPEDEVPCRVVELWVLGFE
jgi:hypothetical protein